MAKWFLSLENFKSIRQLDRMECRPITLLLGPNNAGKTSVLQALLLLKGSLDYPEAVLSFRNDLVDLGSFRETVTQGRDEEGIAVTLSEEKNNGLQWRLSLRVDTMGGTLRMRECEISIVQPPDQSHFLYSHPTVSEEPVVEYEGRRGTVKGQEALEGLRWTSFLPLVLRSGGFDYLRYMFFKPLRYIGPLRVYPERSYRLQPPPTPDVGIDGRWAPYLLYKASEEQRRDLLHWLGSERFDLVQDLRARDVKGVPDFAVEAKIRERWVNLRDIGFGMSQLLPIVVESILVDTRIVSASILLLLEQPEIHLHPKAQADLGTFIAEMAQKGRRYLIETHSEYLLMRLATEVRRKKLSPDDIAIYFLDPDEHGYTRFRNIPLKEDGRLPPPSEWPEGFFDTDIEEADAFLFASQEREEA